MVILKKKSISKDKITYYYQPEGTGDCGVVSYIPSTGDCIIEKMSDREHENFFMYRSKAFWCMKKFVEENEYPETKTVMWG